MPGCPRCPRPRPCAPCRPGGSVPGACGGRRGASNGRRGTVREPPSPSPRARGRRPRPSSRSGMSTGGSLMMRRCPSTSSESFDKACKLSRVFAFARALPACDHQLAFLLRLGVGSHGRQDLVGREARIPDVHGPHLGELGHRLPVGGNAGAGCRTCVGRREAVVPPADHEARRHALDVVLERARQRLVEVVQVEQQRALRRREHAEVRQVRVTAQLDVEPGGGGPREVGGHDLGRAPVEREGRDHHPAVTNRHQVLLAGGVLLLEQSHGVGTLGRRRPAFVAGSRRLRAGFLPPCPPFTG